MSPQYESVLSEAMKLSIEDRQLLAKKLELSVLGLTEQEVEMAWIKIAEQRLKEYEQGKIIAYDVNETIQRLRSKLK
ncbi:MAG: addiction module protein [Bacteroidota bacterium]